MTSPICSFTGRYEFLSNFYYSPIFLDVGVVDLREFATVEHYFQASKAVDPLEFEQIRRASTPGEAKRLGKFCTLRKDWEKVKLEIMSYALTAKFQQHPDLREQLLGTGAALLVEGNTWGDRYWGSCKGKGENHLGRLLMCVRKEMSNMHEYGGPRVKKV